jgi:serine phosphatase RsbU (regulator of sigma subunit)
MKFWHIEAFTEFTTKENFFLGLYYGLFILVIILFSFFGLALRQSLYTYFVVYVFVLGLFQLSLDGLAYQYLWPNWEWFGNHAILVLAAVSMTFMLLYVKNFLDFKTKHPKYLKVYNGFIILILLALLSSLSSGLLYELSFPLLNALSFISILYILYGLILKFKTEDKPEFPLVMAFVGLCLGAIFFILSNVNIINSEFLAANALKLGSATEVIFLSIAMAGRYRKTQVEKIQAQKEAFKRLEEINKLKSEQTERLEKEVAERTQEIREKSEMLSNKNKEIINSINYAKRLQDAILPANETLNQLLPEHGIVYLPKDIVSGDFYWIEQTESHVFFAVADCTGHGVPGAMVSVVGYNSLNRCIRELQLSDPAEILNHLTEMVEDTFSKQNKEVSDGMDIALCVWDRNKQLTYSGAYNPLYLIRNSELIETKANKQPIGKFVRRDPYSSHQLDLEKGDSIFLFSDGYADQFGGEKGKKLKYARFKDYLVELNQKSASEMSEELTQRFHVWRGNNEQIDDVCLMNVRF